MYMSLDFDISILLILCWYFFDYLTGNAILSIGLAYGVELVLRQIRTSLGTGNLVKKTLTDEAFLS